MISVLIMALGAASAVNAESGVSGTYLSQSQNLVEIVQIVVTADGAVAGRMESAHISQSGQVETASTPIEGVADGAYLTFTPKSFWAALDSSQSYSGIVSGATLALSWQGGRRTYRRSDADAFQIALADLQQRANDVVSANAAAQANREYQELRAIADMLDRGLPTVQAQFAASAQSYRALFEQMHNRRRAQAVHSNFPDQGLAAMRAGTDAQGIALEIEALNGDIIALRRQLDGEFARADDLSASLTRYCAGAAPVEPGSSCADSPAQARRLSGLKATYENEFVALNRAYEAAAVDVPPGRRLLENLLR